MFYYCAPELESVFGDDPLQAAYGLQGDVHRALEMRKTLGFEHDGKLYFIKLHMGIDYREVFKNLSQLKLPVISAKNEWNCLNTMGAMGISVPEPLVYFDQGGLSPKRHSFIVMSAIENYIDMEQAIAEGSFQALSLEKRHAIIRKLAKNARIMHQAKFGHRDYYAPHMLIDRDWFDDPSAVDEPKISVLDWHRSIRRPWHRSLKIKDLSGLLFSCADAELTRQDIDIFLEVYCDMDAEAARTQEAGIWKAVLKKAIRTYERDHGRPMPQAFLSKA